MSFASLPSFAWLRIIFALCLWSGLASAQDTPPDSPAPFPPAAPTPEQEPSPASPPGPGEPTAAPGAAMTAEVQAPVPDPNAPRSVLRLVIRTEPAGPSMADILVESDDGQEATTADDGTARLEVAPGRRTLRLTLPLSLLPPDAGADPKVLRLEGIEVTSGQDAELRVVLGPDGNPASLELFTLPPEAPAAPAPGPAAAGAPGAGEHGTIEGRVVAKGATTVSGVSVFVEGLDAEATSDADGRFSLRVPAGRYTVWVIHEQFPTLTLPDVEVKPSSQTEISVELSRPTAQQDDWIIRARYVAGGVASILEERRKSSSVSDALGSEEIAKSPDSSASSATRRIVGASIVGGQYLFARGLGGRYTNVRLNGVPLPSTDPDLPGFQLDLFPASLLSSLVITKTFSPDIPGDFAGGSLNVVTRAFPEKFKLTLSTSVTYNTRATGRDMPTYDGGSLDALGMDDGTRALPDEVPDERVWAGSGLGFDRLVEIGRSFPNEWQVERRKALPNVSVGLSIGDTVSGSAGRLGYLVTLGYRHRFEHFDETITRVGLAGSGSAQSVVELERLNRDVGIREAQIGALGSLSYEPTPAHRVSALTLLTQTGEDRTTFIQGYSEPEGTNIRNTQLRFIERRLLFNQLMGEHKQLADFLDVGWQLNISSTLRDQPGTRDLIYLEGPGGFELAPVTGSGERLYSELGQTDFGGGLNLDFSVWEGGVFKLGYLGRNGSRELSARRFGIQFEGSVAQRRLPPEQLFDPNLSGDAWLIDELTQPQDGYEAIENLNAGFALLDTRVLEYFKLMGGVRVESFHQKIDVASPFALTTANAPEGADRTDVDLLPAAALIWTPRDDMNVRAGYGGTVARPLVRELAPFLNQDFVRRRYAQGNPDLQRTFIHNLDVRWEMFPTPTEVFAVSGFYKIFRDPIETVVLDQNGNLSFENIDGATNYGLELEARIGMGLLSPALESFSALANLAVIRSSVSLSPEQQGLATRDERPLAGQSPYLANVALGYDSEETRISAYLYYNVFGRRIQDVGRLGLPDVYEEEFHSLDATVFWKATDHLTFGASASNLLQSPTLQTQGGLDFSRSERGSNFGLSVGWAP